MMKVIIKIVLLTITVICIAGITSCKKYLDKQPDKELLLPKTLFDLQTLLDDYNLMNHSNSGDHEWIADNLVVPPANWVVTSQSEQLAYTWDKDFAGSDVWSKAYKIVFNANVVLDALSTINSGEDRATYNDVKGQALFFRSFYFWEAAQIYCKPYSTTASADPGIVLRLTSDINALSVRATVEETYGQIIADLQQASALLPQNSVSAVRPDKAAAYALLARVYLSMREYNNAGKYADSALQLQNTLLDYNTLPTTGSKTIPHLNSEVIFDAMGGKGGTTPLISRSDPALYSQYNNDDLRKQVFFLTNADNLQSFRGSYGYLSGSIVFYGLAVDEMYLTRAEAYARAGNKDAALADLNTLIRTRWSNSVAYPTITATDATDALAKILVERRKELIHRGLRWTDLRRFNLEGANITLTHVANTTTYTLPANDLRWVLLIPTNTINMTGMQQNPR